MSRPAGVTRRGVAANDIVGRGMRGRGRRSRRQCSGRALLGCDRRRDFRPSARASCPTSWHSHTHTPHANNMCSALLRVYARRSQPARHTHNNNSDFIYGPVCPNTQESALSFFARATKIEQCAEKLLGACNCCWGRVLAAGGGWATRGGFCTQHKRRRLQSRRALITDYRLSESSSPLPGAV